MLTVNMATEEEILAGNFPHEWNPPSDLPEGITYFMAKLEQGEEDSRMHWHVYAHSKHEKGPQWWKKRFTCPWAHVDLIKREQEVSAVIAYVAKKETSLGFDPIELGRKPGLCSSSYGRKEVAAELAAGRAYEEVAKENPHVTMLHYRGMQELAHLFEPEQELRDIEVIVNWGVPGSGKTYECYNNHPAKDIYAKNLDSTFWDGYRGQPVLLLDEFTGQINVDALKRILDKYPYQINVKGSYTYAKWRRVYITSQHAPESKYFYCFGTFAALTAGMSTAWYGGRLNAMDYLALQRRFTRTTRFDAPYSAPAEGAAGAGAAAEDNDDGIEVMVWNVDEHSDASNNAHIEGMMLE